MRNNEKAMRNNETVKQRDCDTTKGDAKLWKGDAKLWKYETTEVQNYDRAMRNSEISNSERATAVEWMNGVLGHLCVHIG